MDICSTHHQETLCLAMKFNELTDLEANYQLNHHEFCQRQEVERINATNELMTRIHASDIETVGNYRCVMWQLFSCGNPNFKNSIYGIA